MNRIFCTQCNKVVSANKVSGRAIYPHRPDLYSKVFFVCPACLNYVGTHNDGRPLGTIPTPELRELRKRVHDTIDAYWLPTRDKQKRKELYAALSEHMGREYHTGELNTKAECLEVIRFFNNNFNNKSYDI